MNASLIEQIRGIFNDVLEANRHRDSELQQGIEGERTHAFDVLQWVEKLDPGASDELKVAALFHDIDRVVNPGTGFGFPGKRNTPEYFAHKKSHTKRSAEYTASALKDNVEEKRIERICFLIKHHDDTGPEVEDFHDHELEILVAADTFSLFGTTGVKIYEDEGEERFRDKARFMIGKMPEFAKHLLKDQRLENPDFERIKNEVMKELGID